MLPIIPIIISSFSVITISSYSIYKYTNYQKNKQYQLIQEQDIDDWISKNYRKSNLIHRISRINKSSKE